MKIKVSFLLVLMFGLVACSGADRTYQGPGSRWTVVIQGENFTMREFETSSSTEPRLVIQGTTTLNETNRFRSFTVTSAEGENGPETSDTAFGLELEGTALFVIPFGSSTPLVMTGAGACPNGSFAANWVVTKPRLDDGDFDEENFNGDGVGTAVYTPGDRNTENFLVRSAGIVDGVLQAAEEGQPFRPSEDEEDENPGFSMSNCNAGLLSVAVAGEEEGEDEIFDMYFTSTGNIVVKFPESENSSDQIIFGIPRAASPITAANLEGTYSVLVYQGGAAADLSLATLEPGVLSFDDSGDGSLRLLTDIEENTAAAEDLGALNDLTVTDDNEAALPNGTLRFTLAGGDLVEGQISCSLNPAATPRAIACYGFTGTAPNREPITILGHSR